MRWRGHRGTSGDGRKPADYGKIRRRHSRGVPNTEERTVPSHRRCDQQRAVAGADLPIPAKTGGRAPKHPFVNIINKLSTAFKKCLPP